MNMLQLDINQCPDDYYEPNAFKNTHKCDEKSSYVSMRARIMRFFLPALGFLFFLLSLSRLKMVPCANVTRPLSRSNVPIHPFRFLVSPSSGTILCIGLLFPSNPYSSPPYSCLGLGRVVASAIVKLEDLLLFSVGRENGKRTEKWTPSGAIAGREGGGKPL